MLSVDGVMRVDQLLKTRHHGYVTYALNIDSEKAIYHVATLVCLFNVIKPDLSLHSFLKKK